MRPNVLVLGNNLTGWHSLRNGQLVATGFRYSTRYLYVYHLNIYRLHLHISMVASRAPQGILSTMA